MGCLSRCSIRLRPSDSELPRQLCNNLLHDLQVRPRHDERWFLRETILAASCCNICQLVQSSRAIAPSAGLSRSLRQLCKRRLHNWRWLARRSTSSTSSRCSRHTGLLARPRWRGGCMAGSASCRRVSSIPASHAYGHSDDLRPARERHRYRLIISVYSRR